MALQALGRETLAVSSTSVPLASIPTPTNGAVVEALITCEDAAVRWDITSDPTASVGHLLNVGASLKVVGHEDISSIEFIADTGTDGALMITYFGTP